ncbi:sensor histidine kinase [Actinoplanes sp. NPDC023801]|uniref:sensor histidine kinase n=1 Tax=Actinoplanes sp. NPDC023801 TaxID=3154595 RepID=UPI0033E975BD
MRARDAALAAAVFALDAAVATMNTGSGNRPLMPAGWLLLLLASAALLVRRRFPLTVLAVTGAAAVAYYPLEFPDAPIVLNTAIALYTAGRHRGPAWSAGGGTILITLFAATSRQPVPILLSLTPIMALPVTLGEFARVRARHLAHAEERARLAEETRESEALRRTAEERLRIARELHDALGHQLSLISVQAGAALHAGEPEPAFEALRAIRTASKEALGEMRSVLGMLRDAEQPDLTALPGLFARTTAAGLTVRSTVDAPTELAPPVQRAAYRIVQESLTNAVRHAHAASADVHIQQCGDRLRVTVDNPGPPVRPGFTPGGGLRGMTERATALGGTVEAGPAPGGGFRVAAWLPITPLPLRENGPP